MSRQPDDRDHELIDAARRQVRGQGGHSTTPVGPERAETQTARPPPGPAPDSCAGYKIVREIHRGGQSVVYQAFQESTKRKAAIEVMKEGPLVGTADKARGPGHACAPSPG
jgi:hypothetical protein